MSDTKSGRHNDLTHDTALGPDQQGKPVFRTTDTQFNLIEMPPGRGKTINLVIGSVLHRALLKNTPPPSTKGGR